MTGVDSLQLYSLPTLQRFSKRFPVMCRERVQAMVDGTPRASSLSRQTPGQVSRCRRRRQALDQRQDMVRRACRVGPPALGPCLRVPGHKRQRGRRRPAEPRWVTALGVDRHGCYAETTFDGDPGGPIMAAVVESASPRTTMRPDSTRETVAVDGLLKLRRTIVSVTNAGRDRRCVSAGVRSAGAMHDTRLRH